MSDRWETKKRNRPPWFDFLEEFQRMETIMDDVMQRAFETPILKGEKVEGPYVYGFSVSMDRNGKPIIREFGNIQPSREGIQLREEREPIIDILSGQNEVSVVAELPGVNKNEIKLYATGRTLKISVGTAERKYFKELELPDNIDPRSAKANYHNGVLHVKLKKTKSQKLKGESIQVT